MSNEPSSSQSGNDHLNRKKNGANQISIPALGSLIAILISLGGIAYNAVNKQNSLEYVTRADFTKFQSENRENFNAFKLENATTLTELKANINHGFDVLQRQVNSLQFIPIKDFNDFKEKQADLLFEIKKDVDFLKKDRDSIEKKIGSVEARLNTLDTKAALNESRIERLIGQK